VWLTIILKDLNLKLPGKDIKTEVMMQGVKVVWTSKLGTIGKPLREQSHGKFIKVWESLRLGTSGHAVMPLLFSQALAEVWADGSKLGRCKVECLIAFADV
jgi:hypothetical protein